MYVSTHTNQTNDTTRYSKGTASRLTQWTVTLIVSLLVALGVIGMSVPAGASSSTPDQQLHPVSSQGLLGSATFKIQGLPSTHAKTLTYNTPSGAARTLIYFPSNGSVVVYEASLTRQLSGWRASSTIDAGLDHLTIVSGLGGTYLAARRAPSDPAPYQYLYKIGADDRVVATPSGCHCLGGRVTATAQIGTRTFLYSTESYDLGQRFDEIDTMELVPRSGHPVDAQLAHRNEVTIPGGPWTGMTTYQSGTNVFLFLMNANTGRAQVHQIDPNTGAIGARVGNPYSWTTGWTTVKGFQVDGKPTLVMVKKSTGTVHVHRPTSTGRVDYKVQALSWGSGWVDAQTYRVGNTNRLLLAR